MSTVDIDHMEPNGSTALHAAAYYGHIDIVRLLLDKGASSDQKNKYGKTPEEEAKTPEIAELFRDIKAKASFNGTINNVFTAISHHRRFYSFSQGPPALSYVVEKVLNAMNSQKDQIRGYEEIVYWFKKAIQTKDAQYLIRVYTVDTEFPQILDKRLGSHNQLTDEERENPPWFCAYARFLASDEPTLRAYRWTGTCYRALFLTKDDIAQYQVGTMLMNKSFLETTKSYKNIERLMLQLNERNKCKTLFVYVVNDERAALSISQISEFPGEEEVLILLCMDFEITEIKHSDEFTKITMALH